MDDCMDGLHKQERALRAIQLVAAAGFLRDKRSLKRSCLVVCNFYRECLPLRYLKLPLEPPPTLLAVVWPYLLGTKADGASRVLLPKKVLRVRWEFDDPTTADLMELDKEEDEEEEEEEEEDEEDEEDEEEEEEEEGEGGEKEKEKKELEDEKEKEDVKEEDKRNEEDNTKNQQVGHSLIRPCDIDMHKVRWPEGVREIYLTGFNRTVESVIWPDGLEVLAFHIPCVINVEYTISGTTGIFDSPLDGMAFPGGLREVLLGHAFNQSVDGISWPKGLERLSIPGYNHPIHAVQWPPGLKTLEFMKPYELENRGSSDPVHFERQDGIFHQPLGSFLPTSLETLWLSNRFDQSLRGVTWPSGLTLLGLGVGISEESLDGAEWPPSLRILVVAEFCPGLCFQDLPTGCEVVDVWRRDIPDSSDEEENSSSNMSEDDEDY